MAYKIFVSYKHRDSDVRPITQNQNMFGIYGNSDTARSYVDYLIAHSLNDEIYKGERNEDLSQFKDSTIGGYLKNKIYDSSVTIVLVSPNMKDWSKSDSDQWIPWEISYSLKEISRAGRTSLTNAILAVALPDSSNSYNSECVNLF